MKNVKRLGWIVVPALVAAALTFVACSSSSGSASPGSGDGGSGGSSGGGSGGGGGGGACVEYVTFDDAGNVSPTGSSGTAVSCLFETLNGADITGAPCSTGLTYASSCPTQDLQGCCAVRGQADSEHVNLVYTCSYSGLGLTTAQVQAQCVAPTGDGAPGGTWSTTP
jgi:hypothetical protein